MPKTNAVKNAVKKNVRLLPGQRKANPNAKRAMTQVRAAKPIAPMPGGIQERAMLIGLTIRRWNIGRNADADSQAKVEEQFGADPAMTKLRKNLIRREAIAELRILEARMRQEHNLLTLPWQDDGFRILSSKAYFEYQERMTKLQDEYYAEADKLLAQWDELLAEAKQRLGKLFKEKDYPSREAMRRQFVVKFSPRGLPCVEDFRVTGLGAADIAAIKAQYQEELDEAIKAAHTSVFGRMKEVLEHAVERLTAYSVSEDGKVEHTFRESLIGNIKDLLKILPVLNVMEDPAVTKFAAEIESKITIHSAEELRANEGTRKQVIGAADAMLKKLADYI